MDQREALAAAALDLVGSPFRLHGRDPRSGLDCVGVVAVALKAIGRDVALPCDYRLRGGCVQRFDHWAAACGLVPKPALLPIQTGDIVLCAPGAGQFHLMIASGDTLVHAHAGLGRVVAWPGPAPWPVRRCWQLGQG